MSLIQRLGKGSIIYTITTILQNGMSFFSLPLHTRYLLDFYTPNSCQERFQTVPDRTPNYYLATLHRAENADGPKRLKAILKAMNTIGKDMPVILPLHPRTKKTIEAYHRVPETRNIRLIEPASYFDMLELERHVKAILTDSGGVQKEAYWFKVPCFTLRDETEWVETVKSGWNILVKPGGKKLSKQ